MEFAALKERLRHGSAAARKETWKLLPKEHVEHPFSAKEVKELRDLLLDEEDLDVRTTGMICLDRVLHLTGPVLEESFHNWIFQSFRQANTESRSGRKRSIVVTVCDHQYVRDVQAQVEVARHLPADRYPHTVFRHAALHSPDWADVELNKAEAICFIGRPSMFKDCRIIDHFPPDLRFSIEPPGPDESESFFRVCQNRSKAGRLIFPTTQDAARRHDHAIVQRFVIPVGAQKVTVVIIAGGSSLGTFGAAQWLTSFPWNAERTSEYARVSGETIDGSTRVEALLKVSATVHNPARPWRTEIEEKSLFLNKSRNLLKPPTRIALATDSGTLQNADDVRYMLFDEDEVEFASVNYAAAVAVCVKYYLDQRPEMSISGLTGDKRLWPNGNSPVKGGVVNFLRDHLQRHNFNGIVEVAAGVLSFKPGGCKIEVVRAK
jgi:hypothetical protein